MKLLSSTELPRREDFDPNDRVLELLLIANDRYIAQSLNDHTVHILSSSTGVLQRTLVHPVGRPFGLAFDNDNIVVASANDDKLRVYEIPSGCVHFCGYLYLPSLRTLVHFPLLG